MVRQYWADQSMYYRSFPSPDWLIGLVTDVEAPSLELDDVAFLQVLQTGISKHLLLQLREGE